MKRKSIFYLLAMLFIGFVSGCDDSGTNNPNNGGGNTTPDDPSKEKYDVWLFIGENPNSTAKGDPHVVKKFTSLLEGEHDIRNNGAETMASNMTPYVVYKDGYYYSIQRKSLDFGKYKITDNGVETLATIKNVKELCDRRFSHAWINDKTLVMIGAPLDKQSINWVKVDVEKMERTGSGSLALETLTGVQKYNSSGVLMYRKSDNILIYMYRVEDDDGTTESSKHIKQFRIAFIDATTMEIKAQVTEQRADRPGSVSFGTLRHHYAYFDSNDNLYIACNTVNDGATTSSEQHGKILRINRGAMKPDNAYAVDMMEYSKIITIYPIPNNKAIVYLQNPLYVTGKNDWKGDPFVFFWAVVDLKTGESTHLKEIPYSTGGTNVELCAVEKDYAILGTQEKDRTRFYKYDFKTGKITNAASLAEGQYADRIVKL